MEASKERGQAMAEIDYGSRKDIARYLLSRGVENLPGPLDQQADAALEGAPPGAPAVPMAALPSIAFPADAVPTPQPPAAPSDPMLPLPQADAVVITWTLDEVNALADVLTPGYRVAKWSIYQRLFEEHYAPHVRKSAPCMFHRELGYWFPTRIGQLSVLCFKSSLHLNQDGNDGTGMLPVKDLFLQIIDEVKPKVVITTGTAGSVFANFQLGDVVLTRAARFRLNDEFKDAPFNHHGYTSEWTIPTRRLEEATQLMAQFAPDLAEPPIGGPTVNYHSQDLISTDLNEPDIKMEQDARDMPEFHPIITTDYFEYGTSERSDLQAEGCAVEMGDAALGLAASELENPPNWLVIRNMSDPQINGKLPTAPYHMNQQTMWAVGYYTGYGYTTSLCSALATWGVLAGLGSS